MRRRHSSVTNLYLLIAHFSYFSQFGARSAFDYEATEGGRGGSSAHDVS